MLEVMPKYTILLIFGPVLPAADIALVERSEEQPSTPCLGSSVSANLNSRLYELISFSDDGDHVHFLTYAQQSRPIPHRQRW